MTKIQYLKNICDMVRYSLIDGRANSFVLTYGDVSTPFYKLFFYRNNHFPEILLQIQYHSSPTLQYRFKTNNLRGLLATLKRAFNY